MTDTTGTSGTEPDLLDIGDLAEVPADERLDHDEPGDDGLGTTGAEDVSDVPLGEVHRLDEEAVR